MDATQMWTLLAFLAVMSTALLLLELGMRRARAVPRRPLQGHRPLRRGDTSR